MSAVRFRLLTGGFYRIAFAADVCRLLQDAVSPEGRFHHGGQPALYLSPRPDWAAAATRAYRRPGDAPRIVAALDVSGASSTFATRRNAARSRSTRAGAGCRGNRSARLAAPRRRGPRPT
jgi:hypothetical protein